MQPIDADVLRRFPQLADVEDLELSRQARDGSFRLVGSRGDTKVVVEAFPVGSTYGHDYRGWLRIPEPYRRAMMHRPAGFEFFALMVGLLPDDDWRWLCLWPESTVLKYAGGLEPKRSGTLWRMNPGNLDPEERPMVIGNTDREPQLWREQVEVERTVELMATEADDVDEQIDEDERLLLKAGLSAYKPGEVIVLRGVIEHNKGNTTIAFPKVGGSTVKWAVVDSVVPEGVEA